MAKYFIDTEFIEGFHKPLFGRRRHSIDLISIGIVCEDGREYYAISNEFNPKDASVWVRENVLSDIWEELSEKENHKRARLGIEHIGDYSGQLSNKDLKYLLNVYGKSNKQISEDILEFVMPRAECSNGAYCCLIYEPDDADMKSEFSHHKLKMSVTDPEFYGYYSDYDWVLFCSLFGRMIDLPKYFPMYCRDLKQILDERVAVYDDRLMSGEENFVTRLDFVKNKSTYPKQTNEHNALSDARWSYELYKFLQTI